MPLKIIGVDADDTLWHTETVFRLTHKRFNELLSDFADEDTLETRLAAIERENMKAYGYGAKGFTLSMLQTALEVSDGNVSTKVIQELLSAGREMMTHPIEPLPGVEEALKALKERGASLLPAGVRAAAPDESAQRVSNVSRAYRDTRLISIGGGADEVMLGIICKMMNILPSKKKFDAKKATEAAA